MKKKTIMGIISATLVISALLVGTGLQTALADHGGDNGNRGRGNATTQSASQVTTTTSHGSSSGSTGTGMTGLTNVSSSMNKGKGDDGDDNEGNNNNNNAALLARITALETLTQQLQARIIVLEQKVGITDVTPPVITATTAANIANTAADVTWTTNEPATSKVYFSTTTPVNLATATTVSDASLVMSHTLHLTGLTAGTTYHFIVESTDGSANMSRSAEFTFATTNLDVTPPVITATTAASITATTAQITWTTNEAATSKVYFSTTTPVNLLTATNVTDATLATSHSLNLTGLTASTTYHYIVESKDAATNTATSVEQSFTTTP